MISLYNTLARKVEGFWPIKEGEVSLYTCGPTVYDYAHIGNLRAYVFNDTLRRVLEASGYKVKHVMNITDVGHLASDDDEGEDKLEKGAVREGKTVWQVAEHYTGAFKNDVSELNILPPNGYTGSPDGYARATDFIDQQIEIVKLLSDKGFAYKTEQAIYFDVTKLPDYGKLTGQKISDKEIAARSDVVSDKNKHHPQDFALWFFTVGRFENHEMRWPSPWGEGFPGWHLECSAIVHATLGEPIDIHTGGVDHIGTHHTNEIAQTEAAFGKKLANYWLHNEHLLVDNKRMSKSSGNFYTLKGVKDKGFDPMALRLLYLQAHYRSQMNFSWESMQAAQARLQNLYAWSDLLHQQNTAGQMPSKDLLSLVETDLSTYNVLLEIESNADNAPSREYLDMADKLLGLGLTNRSDITTEQKTLIKEREEARKSQDWDRADDLRQKLAKDSIEINDTPRGPIWSRI